MSVTMMTRSRWAARRRARRGPAGSAGLAAQENLAAQDSPAAQRVIWVYGISGSLRPGQISGLTGVGGERVRAVAGAGLTAVVGSVDARTFGEDVLASLLADLTRIELLGRAHHRVIACMAAAGPVLPLRLATICADDDTVRGLLEKRSAEFTLLLGTFRGTEEWGVKVYADPGEGQDGLAESQEASVEVIDRALSGISIAARRHPPEEPLFADAGEWTVYNGAYLISSDRAAEFAAVANALARMYAGFQIRLTGPWPPYSFADSLDA